MRATSLTLRPTEPPPFKRNQFGGQLGGPIRQATRRSFRLVRGSPPAAGTQSQQPGAERFATRWRWRSGNRQTVYLDSARRISSMRPEHPRFVGSASAAGQHRSVDGRHQLQPRRTTIDYMAITRFRIRTLLTNPIATAIPFRVSETRRAQPYGRSSRSTRHTSSAQSLVNELRFGFNRFSRRALQRPNSIPQSLASITESPNRSVCRKSISPADDQLWWTRHQSLRTWRYHICHQRHLYLPRGKTFVKSRRRVSSVSQ